MKKLVLIILTFCSISLVAQTRVVKNPPFSIQNSGTLEIDSIVLNDQSTVFHLVGYSLPQHWIKIDSETYIKANGEKWKVTSANGIELNKEEYPGESGKRIFSLTFPPIPKETEQIDFIESDCETCFKTWGIELQSSTLTNRKEVPQDIKALATIKDDGKPLAAPILKAGDATLKGYLLGYRSEMESKVNIYFNNPLSDDQEDYEVKVADDGSFELKVSMISTAQVLLRVSAPWYNKYILLTPLKETVVYFDLQQMAMNDSRSRIDKTENARSTYFGGANSEINNQFEDLNYQNHRDQFLDHHKIMSETEGMSANQYKEYIMDKCSQAVAGLADKKLTRKTLELAKQSLQYDAMHYLLMGNYFMEQAYRKKNNLDYKAEIPDYHYPIFEKDYYTFLKDYNVNNPISIYNGDYSSTIGGCRNLKFGLQSNISIGTLDSEMVDELIKKEKLKGNELLFAQSLKKNDYNNWPPQKIKEFNEHGKQNFEQLIATEKLTGKELMIAKHIIQLCNSDKNNVKSIFEFGYEITERINSKKLFGEEEFKLADFKYSQDIENPEKELSKEMTEVSETFWKKYENTIKLMYDLGMMQEARKPLASILGTDKGMIFDLMEARIYNANLIEYKPLTKEQLLSISKMSDPFYYNYFLKKNDELVALLKSREGKKLENVFDTPQVEDDKVLYEILKPYEGKVVLIDFWATWCGPCRSAMKDFEPTKKTFEGKDVVFIYLTDESSPMILWENMIETIDGKHFRLKNSQLAYLKKKYGVKGIPSYLILNKKGEQVYFHVGFEGAARIGQILNDELAK